MEVFDEIKERKITAEQIEASEFYGKIADRVDMLPMLEELFDSNDTVFKYNRKSKMFSMIQAEYLMKNMVAGKGVFIFQSGIELEKEDIGLVLKELEKMQNWIIAYKDNERGEQPVCIPGIKLRIGDQL